MLFHSDHLQQKNMSHKGGDTSTSIQFETKEAGQHREDQKRETKDKMETRKAQILQQGAHSNKVMMMKEGLEGKEAGGRERAR